MRCREEQFETKSRAVARERQAAVLLDAQRRMLGTRSRLLDAHRDLLSVHSVDAYMDVLSPRLEFDGAHVTTTAKKVHHHAQIV